MPEGEETRPAPAGDEAADGDGHVRSRGYPPVLVIGMHRSGTSMLVGMLRALGLFVGARLDENNEPPLLVALERRLLGHAAGSWEHPEPICWLLSDASTRALAVEHLRRALHHPRIVSYLGWSRYLRYGTPANLDHPGAGRARTPPSPCRCGWSCFPTPG